MVGLEAGAEDVEDFGEHWQVSCEPTDVIALAAALTEAGLEVLESDSTMMPSNTVPVDDVGTANSVLRLVDALDDHDDVQDIYSNIDISESIADQLAAD